MTNGREKRHETIRTSQESCLDELSAKERILE
jgi:hypothetical protein